MKTFRSSALAGIAACALLTGCGGGGSSSAPPTSGTPAPSPSPTPSPTPTPTPAPTYQTFAALTGDRDFENACAILRVQGSTIAALGATSFGANPFASYKASTQTYSISGNGMVLTYGPTDIDTGAPAGYVAYKKVDAANFTNRFYYFAPSLSTGTLDYTRLARAVSRQVVGTIEDATCVIGVPTLLTDKLPTGTVSYPVYAFRGTAFATVAGVRKQYDLTESTMAFTANPATGGITLTMTLTGREITSTGLSDTRVQFGKFDGATSIDGTSQGYGMTLQSATRTSIGSQAAGWFFGPSGIEVGYTFAIRASDGTGDLEAVGAVLGKR